MPDNDGLRWTGLVRHDELHRLTDSRGLFELARLAHVDTAAVGQAGLAHPAGSASLLALLRNAGHRRLLLRPRAVAHEQPHDFLRAVVGPRPGLCGPGGTPYLPAGSVRTRAQAAAGGRPGLGRRHCHQPGRPRQRGLVVNPGQGRFDRFRLTMGRRCRGPRRRGDAQADGRRHHLPDRVERVRRRNGRLRVRRDGRPWLHRR